MKISLVALAAGLALGAGVAHAQTAAKLKVGLMLPASGTFAALGTAIENGFKLYVTEQGGGAVKFVKDYAASGLKKTIPLYGAGFLTDGTLEAQGADADGLLTTLHYGDSLAVPRDASFRLSYDKAYKLQPDVYAVQGYDAAQMLGIRLTAVKGDLSKKAEFAAAVEKAKIDSPRGAFSVGKSHNPVQDIYLRQVVGKENKVISVASKSLSDPSRGCKM